MVTIDVFVDEIVEDTDIEKEFIFDKSNSNWNSDSPEYNHFYLSVISNLLSDLYKASNGNVTLSEALDLLGFDNIPDNAHLYVLAEPYVEIKPIDNIDAYSVTFYVKPFNIA